MDHVESWIVDPQAARPLASLLTIGNSPPTGYPGLPGALASPSWCVEIALAGRASPSV
jgi:hypothetical protein